MNPSKQERAQLLKEKVTRSVKQELARCEAVHGPDNWALHGDWVRNYVMAGAKEWLSQQARKGAL